VVWKHAPPRKGDIKHSKADISPLVDLGWSPQTTIKQGLRSCFEGLTKNEI